MIGRMPMTSLLRGLKAHRTAISRLSIQTPKPTKNHSMSFSSLFYEPFITFNEFNRLFDQAFKTRVAGQRLTQGGDSPGPVIPFHQPKLDIREGPNNTVTAQFELPGLKKEDVSIEAYSNRLIISGESKSNSTRDEDDFVVRERHYGKFSRSIPLPVGTEPEQIKANVADGILTVTFPKVGLEHEPKKITIT